MRFGFQSVAVCLINTVRRYVETMAATLLDSRGITCHAWNHDCSQVAICPNNNEILIYDTNSWKLLFSLKEHDLLVSGIDWCPVHNKIVSCSHDRNAFVWTYQAAANGETATWKPALVLLRIDRAAMDVKWSLDGLRFAVGSASKAIPVCTYDAENDWWVSRHVKKKIKSTVTCVAFHPKNGQILAAGGTDFKCRVFSTYSADVDGGEVSDVKSAPFASPVEFGDVYCELSALGWINACAWSPSGDVLCYAGHDSSIHFVNIAEGSDPAPQCIRFPDMPLSCVMFASDQYLLGGGHDFNPVVFKLDNGTWSFKRKLDEKKTAIESTNSSVGAARALFQNKTRTGQDAKADGDTLWTQHENVITCISRGKEGTLMTSSLDGKVVLWNAATVENALEGLKIK